MKRSYRQPDACAQSAERAIFQRHITAVEAGNVAESSPGDFPSRAHRQSLAQQPLELPLLGSDGMHARPTMQDFVQRVHQQGLPVARLLETKSALLHLGLNARGKPGLWLVQKTH